MKSTCWPTSNATSTRSRSSSRTRSATGTRRTSSTGGTYHHSFKIFGIQHLMSAFVQALHALLPECPFAKRFERIIEDGTGKTFSDEMNATWDTSTRPLLDAFFHARYFLTMAIKYGNQLHEVPSTLPSGWTALLHLYDIR